MADEIKKVITVDVSDALDSLDDLRDDVVSAGYSFKSLGDAKKYIDTLRASLIDLDESSEEYEERVEEIDKVQDKLNKAMKVTGDRTKDAEGSYNALSKQMSELKKQFKATNDEAERQVLAKQITGINEQLKTMDASIGNFQRNVGNYEGAFTKGLEGISKKIESLGNPLAIAKNGVKSLGTAMKALATNPIGAIIMAIVAAVSALKKGFAGSEEASNRLKKAFSAFQPVINAIQNLFTGFANTVSKIAEKVIPAFVNSIQKAGEGIMKFLNKIGVVSDERLEAYKKSVEAQKEAVETTQKLTEREIALTQKKRQFQIDEAKTEMEVAELRAKAADKETYTAEQREKFLESAISKEKALNATKLAIAEEEFKILKERSELTAQSKEDNDALAAAEANLYNVRKEYYEKERGLLKEKQKAGKELTKEEDDRLKEVESIIERTTLAQMDGKDRELTVLKNKYEEEKALLEAYEKDTTALTEEYEKKKLEIIDKYGGEEVRKIQERLNMSDKSGYEKELNNLKTKYEEEKKLLESFDQDTTALTEEYNKKLTELNASMLEDKSKNIDEEFKLEQELTNLTVQDAYERKTKILDIERERLLEQKGVYEELLSMDNLSVEKREEYAKQLMLIEAELTANSEENKQLRIEHIQAVVDKYSQMAQSIGDLMGTISDIWQDSIKERLKNKKISEEVAKKEFEDSKKLQVATAVINGLAGVAMAVSTAMSLGPIAGPIMAAVNSALVIATTAAQIAKIKSTTLDGGEPPTTPPSAEPSIQAVAYTPQYTANMTGESDTVNLADAIGDRQSSQRVYVVESDITEAGKRVEVRESESTF